MASPMYFGVGEQKMTIYIKGKGIGITLNVTKQISDKIFPSKEFMVFYHGISKVFRNLGITVEMV